MKNQFQNLKKKIIKILFNLLILIIPYNSFHKLYNLSKKKNKEDNTRSTWIDSFLKSLNLKKKLYAFDIGSEGGFNIDAGLNQKYINNFIPIMSEPREIESKNKNFTSKAFWSSKGKKILYVTGKNPSGSSFYIPDEVGFSFHTDKKGFKEYQVTDKILVKTTTISHYLNELNIKNIDYLKIDTQGAELEILKGLGKFRPLLAKVEVQIIPLYKNVPSWTELVDLMRKYNYIVIDQEQFAINRFMNFPHIVDMIFIPNFLTTKGKEIINSRKKEFIFLMLVCGEIKILQKISSLLNFSEDKEIQNLKIIR
jgi:FkbM family methyltransferase